MHAKNDGHKCRLFFSTYKGSDCYVFDSLCRQSTRTFRGVLSASGPRPSDGKGSGWNVCFAGGVQYFHFGSFGDFSIEFSQAGGVKGNTVDGLHNPLLRVTSIGNWETIDADRALTQTSGNTCQGPGQADTQDLARSCSLPKMGGQYDQLSNNPGVSAASGDNQYYVALRIVDNAGTLIGQVGNRYSIGNNREPAGNPTLKIDSLLPNVLVYTRHGPDNTTPHFDYAGEHWGSVAPQCSAGNFDFGSRQGGCSFACP